MSSSPSIKPKNEESVDSHPTSDHPKPLEPENPFPTIEETLNQQGEQEEGECGVRLFMKGGGCKQVFINWENCIEGEKNNENIDDKCFEATSILKKCMESHSDYYAPILQAEKAAEQEAIHQLDKDKEAGAAAALDSGEEQQKPVSS